MGRLCRTMTLRGYRHVSRCRHRCQVVCARHAVPCAVLPNICPAGGGGAIKLQRGHRLPCPMPRCRRRFWDFVSETSPSYRVPIAASTPYPARWEKGLRARAGGGGGGSFESLYPKAGWSQGKGPPHRAHVKWQSEDQSWLRNWAAKRREPKKFKNQVSPSSVPPNVSRRSF